jgi:hypothetical protein
MTPEIKAPAPWSLTGSGYIFVYKFAKDFVRTQGFVPPFLEGRYRGGFGAVMLVDYHTSDVGGYRELLFIPGVFDFGGKNYYSITKIYVSTMASVVNGRENWGIPKELADFDIQRLDEHSEQIRASANGVNFFDTTLIAEKLVRLPINTGWLPIKQTLVQQGNDKLLLTTPSGRGVAQLATIVDMQADGGCFPDIAYVKPLAAVKVTNFGMMFPVAEELAKI